MALRLPILRLLTRDFAWRGKRQRCARTARGLVWLWWRLSVRALGESGGVDVAPVACYMRNDGWRCACPSHGCYACSFAAPVKRLRMGTAEG